MSKEPVTTDRRRHFRVPCRIEVVFRIKDRDEEGTACLVNLGVSGARVDFPLELPLSCTLEVELPPPTATTTGPCSGPLVLPSQVAWTTVEATGPAYPTGLQFDCTEPLTHRLEDYIRSLM